MTQTETENVKIIKKMDDEIHIEINGSQHILKYEDGDGTHGIVNIYTDNTLFVVTFEDTYDRYDKGNIIAIGSTKLEAIKKAKKFFISQMLHLKQRYLDVITSIIEILNDLDDDILRDDLISEAMDLYAKLYNIKGLAIYYAIEKVIDETTKIIRRIMKEDPNIAVELFRLVYDFDDLVDTEMDRYKRLLAITDAYKSILYLEKKLECEASGKDEWLCVNTACDFLKQLENKAKERVKKIFS